MAEKKSGSEAGAQTGSVLAALSGGIADAVEAASPAILRVNGRHRRPASGVHYAEDLVLTASHSVERDEGLSVETHDGRRLRAEIVGRDPQNDLALLRAAGLGSENIATPADREPRVGELALTLGRASGEGVRASLGVVSALGSGARRGRRRWGWTPDRYVQTDAAPYQGLGGGALLDASGEVLGIVVASFRGSATVAIPADVAWSRAESLRESGSLKRGYLGIYSQPVKLPQSARRDQENGLLVVGVGEDTPAARGGLMVGDILVSVDGHAVEDTYDLLNLLDGGRAGKTVALGLLRGGRETEVRVTVGERGREG
ncbi:S1C family serine protease [Rubrobacter radiotolerans]|nr:S1C family serine protease [Rubrobacter radiotolerans]MDX5892682.1 S1C family serine protease [Rubrobacter radiotolerans]SMC08111.1 serine protease, S1-C subfamily, contains C-terminal PDZ domain [Rubrobacter radiotolerans DSM 5868]